MKLQFTAPLGLLVATAAFGQTQSACENLAKLTLPNTAITLAQVVAAGEFVQPAGGGPGGGRGRGPNPVFKTMPAFCRVAVTLTPTSDSDIKSEVWLPMSGWNGKFEVVGNGGWAGSISYPNLGSGVVEGYAMASTDTGHTGGGASFAYNHPEKMLDFGFRAVHETTAQGKALIKAFYNSPQKEAYFNGCSTGGRQAMNAVQRYPADFDGVIAGAQVNPMTRLHAGSLHNTIFAHKDNEIHYIPPSKYPMIHKAVIDKCDALDGVKDGLIENPMACHFDPKELLCKGADSDSCLTAPQVELAEAIYGGTKNPRTGTEVFPGWSPGSELGWGVTAGPQPEGPAVDTYRFVVFKNPDWDWHTLNFDSDMELADKNGNATINAVDTDLTPFVSRGGKLLLFHGWADPNVAPRNTVNYYNRVLDTMGADKISNSIRLFMVPGMGHCGGGEGPNDFDKVAAIDSWVTSNKAPDSLIASHLTAGKVDRTRPLCPYPQVAKYKGTGSIDEAANFSCVLEKK